MFRKNLKKPVGLRLNQVATLFFSYEGNYLVKGKKFKSIRVFSIKLHIGTINIK